MTTEQSKPTTQRAKLAITSVNEPKAYGDKGRHLVDFRAKPEGGDKELRYACFRDSLFSALKANTTIEADVETKEVQTEDGTRINRTLQQVYVDGQPLGGQRDQGGQRGQWGKSPEQLALERVSIEKQVALKELGESLRSGLWPHEERGRAMELFERAIWQMLDGKLPAGPGPKLPGKDTKPPAPAPAPATDRAAMPAASPIAPAPAVGSEGSVSAGGHQAAPQAPPTAATPPRDPNSVTIYSDLLKACHADFGMQPKQVFAELNVAAQSELTEAPADCYRRISAIYAVEPFKGYKES